MLACFVLFSWTGEQLKWIQMQLLGFWSGLKEAHDKRTNGTKQITIEVHKGPYRSGLINQPEARTLNLNLTLTLTNPIHTKLN